MIEAYEIVCSHFIKFHDKLTRTLNIKVDDKRDCYVP